MARFAQIVRGTRARKTCTIEGIDGEDGKPAPFDVRPLNGIEGAEVLAKARAFAVERGVKEPKDGEPIYELGRQVHTLLLGTIDVDSPVDAPRPFFASADEVLSLDRDRRSYMFELQESWEDQCAPRPDRMNVPDFTAWCMSVCTADEGDDGPFVRLRPVLRWSCVRTLASIHILSQSHKYSPGSDTESDSPTSTSSPDQIAAPQPTTE
jgi:hypothetical protein